MVKDKYICTVPFTSMEVQETMNHLCCPSWVTLHLPKRDSLIDSWNSKEANEVRDSVLDGTYKYCDSKLCPFLRQLEFDKMAGQGSPFVHKNKVPKEQQDKLDKYEEGTLKPEIIQFSFDRSCNLKCPSCRVDFITSTGKTLKKVEKTIEEIEEQLSDSIKTLYITGTGDPFTSPSFRNFLRNFDKKRYPVLNNIHLHTNATKWNPKMWESMKGIHPYVKTCEISIDAGTKDTYENKTRLGGNWDELLENLKFIKTLPKLKKVKVSFVVQQANYKEMETFYDLMTSIFGNKVLVYFGKIINWGTFSEEEFKNHKVWDETHPEFEQFVQEVNKALPRKQALSNLGDYIIKSKSLL